MPSLSHKTTDCPNSATNEEHALMARQAHEQGVKNMEFHIASAEILSKNANNTVNMIGAAGLGALGYTAHLLKKRPPSPSG